MLTVFLTVLLFYCFIALFYVLLYGFTSKALNSSMYSYATYSYFYVNVAPSFHFFHHVLIYFIYFSFGSSGLNPNFASEVFRMINGRRMPRANDKTNLRRRLAAYIVCVF